MKRIALLILAVLFIAGCAKEETEQMILGVWDIDYSYIFDGRSLTKQTGRHLTWEFLEDGEGFQDEDRFTYAIDGDYITIDVTGKTERKTWRIIDMDKKHLHVSCYMDSGNEYHHLFNRTK